MILNDREIIDYLKKGLTIDPYQPANLSPASYDLSVGAFQSINFQDHHLTDNLAKQGFIEILPGEAFLLSTIEIVGLPANITGEIVNKSSTSRKGLFLASPGWVDPGFIGQLTIAMKNETLRDIKLEYGQRLWQIVFAFCNPAEQAYQGHYQGSRGIVPSKV